MKAKLLKIEDELQIVHDAYEGLHILLGQSQSDSERITPIVIVINEKLKRCLDELEKARNGTLSIEDKITKLDNIPNQP